MKLSDHILNSKAQIKNIIFDWGGVITNLDFDAGINAFKKYGLDNFIEQYNMQFQKDIYTKLETGLISADEFRAELRKIIPVQITDNELDEAWSALLGELPKERWELLHKIKDDYRTYLLSNTNVIHVERYFRRLYEAYGIYGYTHLFEKTYFSYELKMRKPDIRIFEYVLKDSNLKPEETLLIDDYHENIESAGRLGIITFHLKEPETILDIFKDG
jgi:epoxide hydrolase-like predicted phosphatase